MLQTNWSWDIFCTVHEATSTLSRELWWELSCTAGRAVSWVSLGSLLGYIFRPVTHINLLPRSGSWIQGILVAPQLLAMIQHGIGTFEAECLLKAYLKCLHKLLSKRNSDFTYFYQWPKFKTSKSNSSIAFILPIPLYSSFTVFTVKDTISKHSVIPPSVVPECQLWIQPTGNLVPTPPLAYTIPTSLE